ncbi:methyl-accepting chemotaxis protein [Undibacterium rugosum]|uniref:methyl-accepting chemotaxis protein n=1 Tax=Undibacterium rugosum TaxID=2762291 RepID=UPI001B82B2D1|nr:PAS domain-containing methyl-accepting chemotaxis protein [Undibacterium rugosum]MBR7777168.1 PAS domain-containing protein [Undibacterium rugosum]
MSSQRPVTKREYVLSEGETIVSKTDLAGNITYANDDFVRVSGFTMDELMGAPQNIVRHPDMPAAAFADFWRTLQSGKAWNGLVKNRCKNGDYYWVETTAAPLVKNGKVVGYTSIRVKPERQQIRAAEFAYKALQRGDPGLSVREGCVVRHSAAATLRNWLDLSVRDKLVLYCVLTTMILVLTAILPAAAVSQHALWAAALGAVLTALFCRNLYRSIAEPLHQLEAHIHAMSSGDLSLRITVSDNNEISEAVQSLRVLQTNIKLLIGQIKQSTGHVNAVAVEIAECSYELSAHTESQKSALDETTSSMDELTSTVQHNADNSTAANTVVMSSALVAEQGGQAVGNVVQTMGAIKTSSGKIADIIGVIDSIAFQTNILALNAAVEAARAGEQGRGFAVVASEVRTLAQRSANAAKEIKTLITDSVNQVEMGARLVDDAGKTMDGLVSGVRQVAQIMQEFSIASQEQSAQIGQLNQAVLQIDDMTQQNTLLVDEAASSAESLRRQAGLLAELVNSFKLVPNGELTATAQVRLASVNTAGSVQITAEHTAARPALQRSA